MARPSQLVKWCHRITIFTMTWRIRTKRCFLDAAIVNCQTIWAMQNKRELSGFNAQFSIRMIVIWPVFVALIVNGCANSPYGQAKRIGCEMEKSLEEYDDLSIANAYGSYVNYEKNYVIGLSELLPSLPDGCYENLDKEVASRGLFKIDDWKEIRDERIFVGQNWLVAAAAIGPVIFADDKFQVQLASGAVTAYRVEKHDPRRPIKGVWCSGLMIVFNQRVIGHDIYIREELTGVDEVWGKIIMRTTPETKVIPAHCASGGAVIKGAEYAGGIHADELTAYVEAVKSFAK